MVKLVIWLKRLWEIRKQIWVPPLFFYLFPVFHSKLKRRHRWADHFCCRWPAFLSFSNKIEDLALSIALVLMTNHDNLPLKSVEFSYVKLMVRIRYRLIRIQLVPWDAISQSYSVMFASLYFRTHHLTRGKILEPITFPIATGVLNSIDIYLV